MTEEKNGSLNFVLMSVISQFTDRKISFVFLLPTL